MASAAPEIPVLARNQAFEILYRRYVTDVYHYALALLRNPADAEDVTQTTFLNAYRAYQRGVEVEKPQNWLIKIAHNVARTRYTQSSRRVKEVPLEDHLEQLAVPEEERPNIEGVLRALGRLPFNQRAALVMRELEGRSYVEIADTIGVSVSAVETLIFRARRSLRLKASALRTLAAVPLPNSLAQLFEGGGVVAGGGAMLGSGFLVKAVVALIVGAVATGIGRDHLRSAAASQDPPAAARSAGDSSRVTVRRLGPPSVKRVRVSASKHLQRGLIGTVPESPRTAQVLEKTPSGGDSGGSSPAQAAPTSQVTSEVTNVVSTVESVVSAPAPTLPVQPPSLPPVPLDVPKLPAPVPLP
jgi:RNA polymerase sigma factor (sigma-70 family)